MADCVDDFIRLENPGLGSITGDVDSPPADEELLRILECPVCAEFPTPPIYNCAKGHFICNGCIMVLNACTTCESPFTRVRNYALEAIVERTKFKCKYKDQGCEESILGCAYLKHVIDCPHGSLRCPEENCVVRSPPDQYINHVTLSHGAIGCVVVPDAPLSGCFIQRFGDKYPMMYIQRPNNCAFLLHTRVHKSFICWWISCVYRQDISTNAIITWSKAPAADNGYSDARALDDKNLKQPFIIKWKIPIQNANQSFDFIRDSGACAVLPVQQLNQFQNTCDGKTNVKCWMIQVDITSDTAVEDVVLDDGANARPMWNVLKHYSPLLVLIVVGVLLCLFYGSQETANATESDENYFGYRGFYYPNAKKRSFVQSYPNSYIRTPQRNNYEEF